MSVIVGPVPCYERKTVPPGDVELTAPPWPRHPRLGDDVLYDGRHWTIQGIGNFQLLIAREIDPWHGPDDVL